MAVVMCLVAFFQIAVLGKAQPQDRQASVRGAPARVGAMPKDSQSQGRLASGTARPNASTREGAAAPTNEMSSGSIEGEHGGRRHDARVESGNREALHADEDQMVGLTNTSSGVFREGKDGTGDQVRGSADGRPVGAPNATRGASGEDKDKIADQVRGSSDGTQGYAQEDMRGAPADRPDSTGNVGLQGQGCDDQFCSRSPEQLCRMKCPTVESFDCKQHECLMRIGTCCDFKCQGKDSVEVKQAEIRQESRNASGSRQRRDNAHGSQNGLRNSTRNVAREEVNRSDVHGMLSFAGWQADNQDLRDAAGNHQVAGRRNATRAAVSDSQNTFEISQVSMSAGGGEGNAHDQTQSGFLAGPTDRSEEEAVVTGSLVLSVLDPIALVNDPAAATAFRDAVAEMVDVQIELVDVSLRAERRLRDSRSTSNISNRLQEVSLNVTRQGSASKLNDSVLATYWIVVPSSRTIGGIVDQIENVSMPETTRLCQTHMKRNNLNYNVSVVLKEAHREGGDQARRPSHTTGSSLTGGNQHHLNSSVLHAHPERSDGVSVATNNTDSLRGSNHQHSSVPAVNAHRERGDGDTVATNTTSSLRGSNQQHPSRSPFDDAEHQLGKIWAVFMVASILIIGVSAVCCVVRLHCRMKRLETKVIVIGETREQRLNHKKNGVDVGEKVLTGLHGHERVVTVAPVNPMLALVA